MIKISGKFIPEKKEIHKMTTLILVRHGESEANRQDLFAGHFDADLQNRGMEQARKTAKFLSENFKIDKVYASDLKRAYKTGKCIAEQIGIEVIPNKNLREINAGEWEGKYYYGLEELYPKEWKTWIEDIGNAYCPGGESTKQLCERVMGEIEKIAKENEGKTVVLATHATPVRIVETMLRFGDLGNMKNVPWVSNASATVVSYEKGKWTLIKRSMDEHLGELKTVLPDSV